MASTKTTTIIASTPAEASAAATADAVNILNASAEDRDSHPSEDEGEAKETKESFVETLDDGDIKAPSDSAADKDIELQSLIIKAPSYEDDGPFLPQDTFSFISCSHLCSLAFFLAIAVFLLQVGIYALLLFNITDMFASIKVNPLNFPVNVEMPVRIAEVVAIIVAIITHDEMRKAVTLTRDGYNKDLENEDAFPGAKEWKWILSIVMRSFEGFFGIFLSFLLIMQSTAVLELLLNFLALEFVSQLDDVVFILARDGFLTRPLMEEAKKLSLTFTSLTAEPTTGRWHYCVPFIYYLVLSAVFFTSFGLIYKKQKNGEYLCSDISVQFDVEEVAILGTFTGVYSLAQTKPHNKGRLSYMNNKEEALLAYCPKDQLWTLSLSQNNEPCNNWIAASDVSTDFDVSKTADSQWVFRDYKKNRFLPLSQHYLECHDPNHVDDFCGRFGELNDDDGKCECKDDHYGPRCEYAKPCKTLGIYPVTPDRTYSSSSLFAYKYYQLGGEDLKVFNRPVYTQKQSDDSDIGIILFTGARWILNPRSSFDGLDNSTGMIELIGYFSNLDASTLFEDYKPFYVSESVHVKPSLYDYINDKQSGEYSDPRNLDWYYSSASLTQELQPDSEKDSVEYKFKCMDIPTSTAPEIFSLPVVAIAIATLLSALVLECAI